MEFLYTKKPIFSMLNGDKKCLIVGNYLECAMSFKVLSIWALKEASSSLSDYQTYEDNSVTYFAC